MASRERGRRKNIGPSVSDQDRSIDRQARSDWVFIIKSERIKVHIASGQFDRRRKQNGKSECFSRRNVQSAGRCEENQFRCSSKSEKRDRSGKSPCHASRSSAEFSEEEEKHNECYITSDQRISLLFVNELERCLSLNLYVDFRSSVICLFWQLIKTQDQMYIEERQSLSRETRLSGVRSTRVRVRRLITNV